MADHEVRIVSATDAPWPDVEKVFGSRGDPSRCWCQWFKLPRAGWDASTRDACRTALQEQVETATPPPGVIGYLDDEAVGWCAVEPRTAYPRLARSRAAAGSAEPWDDADVWAVTCFVVRVGFRRRGVASALLRGAIAQACRHGARVIEGYPIDTTTETAESHRKASSADLYHGTLSQFLDVGFEVTARPSPHRAVVSLQVGAPGTLA